MGINSEREVEGLDLVTRAWLSMKKGKEDRLGLAESLVRIGTSCLRFSKLEEGTKIQRQRGEGGRRF